MKIILFLLILFIPIRNSGQWDDTPPQIRSWYQSLMQPDNPYMSCCGQSDAFEARVIGEDRVTRDIIVVIDDGKGVIPDGIQVRAPRTKIQVNYGNPTGKLIIFIGGGLTVYCLIPQTEG
jgi:hypothetical protein